MRKIQRINKPAHDYFMREECGPKKWDHFYFLEEGISPFGHRTSNIVECVNGAWLEYQKFAPCKLFNATQLWCFERKLERYDEAKKLLSEGKRITPWAKSLIKGGVNLVKKRNYRYWSFVLQ